MCFPKTACTCGLVGEYVRLVRLRCGVRAAIRLTTPPCLFAPTSHFFVAKKRELWCRFELEIFTVPSFVLRGEGKKRSLFCSHEDKKETCIPKRNNWEDMIINGNVEARTPNLRLTRWSRSQTTPLVTLILGHLVKKITLCLSIFRFFDVSFSTFFRNFWHFVGDPHFSAPFWGHLLWRWDFFPTFWL